MKSFAANWKTSAAGVAAILICVLSFFGVKIPGVTIDPSVSGTLLPIGLGLLFAKDGNVTGGNVKQ